MTIASAKDLILYKKPYALGMRVFEEHKQMTAACAEIGRMLGSRIKCPTSDC